MPMGSDRWVRLRRRLRRERPQPVGLRGIRAYADEPMLVLPMPWDDGLLAVPVRATRRPR